MLNTLCYRAYASRMWATAPAARVHFRRQAKKQRNLFLLRLCRCLFRSEDERSWGRFRRQERRSLEHENRVSEDSHEHENQRILENSVRETLSTAPTKGFQYSSGADAANVRSQEVE